MNTYPDLPTSYGSDPEPITKPVVDRAVDNSARVWISGDDKVKLTDKHPRLTAAQKAVLEAFYAANKGAFFYHVSKLDGATRTLFFSGGAPKFVREKGNCWTATVPMEQA